MTLVDRKDDYIALLRKVERRLARVERTRPYDDDGAEVPLPPDVALHFRVREFRSKIDYKAHVQWDVVSPNTCQADVDYWVVQLQATNAAGVPRDELSDSDGTPYTYERNVNNKADVDTPHAIFDSIPHPNKWYYRARVRIVDKAHRKGPFSDWTDPVQPADVSLPRPPVPTGLAINFQQVDKDRWDRQQAEVSCEEIGDWDIPGDRSVVITNATAASNIATITTAVPHYLTVGDKVEITSVQPTDYNTTKQVTDVVSATVFKFNLGSNPANLTDPGIAKLIVDNLPDVAEYQFKFRRCSAGGVAIGGTRKRLVKARDADADTEVSVTFEKGVKKRYYYQANVRAIDRFNRKGDWSGWTTPATPDDLNPPPVPINVEAYGTIRAYGIEWDHPPDADDADINDEDVAYFQVQASTKANFSDIVRRDMYVGGTKKEWESRAYRQRFWLRVRSVDASGNKSAWVTAGPIRPVKSEASKRTTARGTTGSSRTDVDVFNDNEFPLIAGPTNQARSLSTPVGLSTAVAEGEAANGVITCELTTGSVADRIYAGVCFRRQDSNDYLYAAVVDIAGTNGILLGRVNAGTPSTLASSTSLLVQPETTYVISVDLNGTAITVSVNGVQYINSTSSAYQTETEHGLFIRTGASGNDNQQTRFHDFKFVPDAIVVSGTATWNDSGFTWGDSTLRWDGSYVDTVFAEGIASIDDDFERDATGSGLGTASSGHVWTVDAGTWAIEQVTQPYAIMGSAVILPLLSMERTTKLEFNAPASGTRDIGRTGIDSGPLEFVVDRPTRLMGDAVIVLGNQSTTTEYNARCWLMYQVGNIDGTGMQSFTGRASTQHFPVDQVPVTKWRTIAIMHEKFVDASPSSPKLVRVWWSFRNDTAQGRNMELRDARMRILAGYAPDYAESWSPTRRAMWSPHGVTRAAYRTSGGDDNT